MISLELLARELFLNSTARPSSRLLASAVSCTDQDHVHFLVMGQHCAPALQRGPKAVHKPYSGRELAAVALFVLAYVVISFLPHRRVLHDPRVGPQRTRLIPAGPSAAAAKQAAFDGSLTSNLSLSHDSSSSSHKSFLNSSSQPAPSPKTRTCAEQAAADQPTEQEVGALLGHQLRQLPSTGSSSPVLSASNWEGTASREHAELPRQVLVDSCGGHLFRYRVVSGVVYSDHDYNTNTILAWHRNVFLEMLLVSVWLYKSFPDVDLWVSFSDEPSSCNLTLPVLQYTVIGADVVRQAQRSSSAVLQDGSTVSVTQLLTGGGEPPVVDAPAPKFYRGWAFNYPFSWQQLSYLPSVLQRYQRCLQDRVGGRPSKAQLIWRGSNTGSRRGWAPLGGASSPLLQVPWGVALANKRMALALLARSHGDWMDVGLHEVIPEIMMPEGKDKQLVQDLRRLVIRGYVPQEAWGSYALQLSIDGHGSPNRLPLQYLQGSSAILKVMSPFKDAFEERFQSGTHYAPVRYDLADLVTRGQALLATFSSNGTGQGNITRMAQAAAGQAVTVFTLLGQLDALAYAALKVKSVCKWQVQPPRLRLKETASTNSSARDVSGTDADSASGGGWEVLKLERSIDGSKWISPSLQAGWAQSVRDSLLNKLSHNFHVYKPPQPRSSSASPEVQRGNVSDAAAAAAE
eukprot:GHRQ01005930.1.p1 GENE.GHRQ01005930.1~~GHRQ01005930.1.p1  ORF type:complete len:686 (+),score=207.85 GHRQ01005930.1:51-2108(+)